LRFIVHYIAVTLSPVSFSCSLIIFIIVRVCVRAWFFIAFFLYAARISDIEFVGEFKFPKSLLIRGLGVKNGSVFNESAIRLSLDSLRQFLESKGALLATVDSANYLYSQDSSRVSIRIYGNSGTIFKLGQVTYKGVEGKDSVEIYKQSSSLIGKDFTSELRENLMTLPLNVLASNGYPFARTRIADFSLSEERINLVIEVVPGPLVVLQGLRLAGNPKTRVSFFERKSGIRFPSAFSQKKMQRMLGFIVGLEYIRLEGNYSLVEDADGRWWVLLKITERNNNALSGAISYLPEPGNNRLAGTFNFRAQNLFGTGRGLELDYLGDENRIHRFRLIYKEPFLWHFEGELKTELERRIKSYSKDFFEIALTYPVHPSLKIGGRFGFAYVNPDSHGLFVNRIPETKEYRNSFVVGFENFDLPYNPGKGFGVSTEAGAVKTYRGRLAEANAGLPSQSWAREFKFGFNIAVPLEMMVFIIGSNYEGRWKKGSKFALPELFSIGGAKTLRGYREEEFSGSEILTGRFELKLRIVETGKIFLFSDMGWYRNEGHWSSIKLGYGLGFRIPSRIGGIEIAYALTPNRPIARGVVHTVLYSGF